MRTTFVLLSCLLIASCTSGDQFTDAGPDTSPTPVDSGVEEFTVTVTHSGNSDGVVTSTPEGVSCGATCTILVPSGTSVTLAASPDANTDFTGWSGAGCTGTGDCVLVVTADVTVDAAFDLQRFTVTAEATGSGGGTITSTPAGIDCGADCDEVYDHGTTVTLHATADSGTTFLGWTGGDCTGTADCVIDVTADVTIQAAFGLDHSLNVVLGGNGTGTVTSAPAGIACGVDCDQVYSPGTMVTLTAAATGDSYFDGWTGGGCSGLGTCVVTVDDAVAVTATFTLNTHTLDVTIDGTGAGDVASTPAGIDCGSDCSGAFDSGTDVVLTPTPSAGRFAGWVGGGCTGLTACTIDLTTDTAVTATFDLITVTDVTSSAADGRYTTAAVIPVQVTFNNPVVVTGTPAIALGTGGSATYASGSGTAVLTFNYTVAAGQNTADLDYVSTSSLAGGTIKGTAGDDATLTLPTPGSPTSLGGHKAIIVDTAAPTVASVGSPTANGTYGVGGVINVAVTFSEPVIVTGTPTLVLNSGATVNYTSGSGGATLTFAYTVAAGQNTADLDAASTTALAGGTIRDAATNTATLTVPVGATATSLATAKNLVVDTSAPTVSNVTSSTTNGTYGAGVAIAIQVTFTEAVTVTGTPTIALNSGGTATYASGTGTTTLTFTYTTAGGQNTADLDYAATSSLALAGGTIKDAPGNNATLTLPAVGGAGSLGLNKAIVVDTAAPTVTNVTSSTANGSYGVAAAIAIQVTFSEPVTVTGTPSLALNTGAAATYASGSGTATLTLTYTVGAAQNTTDLDYAATGSLTGGTIVDAGANAATRTLAAPGAVGSLGNAKAIVIDTIAPTVTGVTSSTANGTYGVGGVISIQVGFSETVAVTGTPTLTLNTGATVSYTSGTGTATLTFTYTVGAAQNTTDLDYGSTGALTGTIRDAAANAATLTLAAPGAAGSLGASKALVIDTSGPIVTNVTSSTANGSYGAASVISIQVTFAEAVTVTGTPTLTLNTGATVSYTSGSGTATLTFTYTVGAAQNTADLDYGSTAALSGTIRDGASNNATLTLPAVGGAGSLGANKAIVIDTAAPTVTGVTSSTTNGSYKAAAVISIQVGFSELVNVTGTPVLALNTGGSATYASGTGTSTLTFTYTVAAGHNAADLDYAATGSLTAGTITDAAANAATRTLATPGAAGSLGNAKNLVIDTTAPTVTSVTTSTADGSYNAPDVISIQVVFSEAVTVTGTPSLTLNSGGSASYASGTGTSTLTFTYTVGAGQNAADLDYSATSSLSGTIADPATNAATLTLPGPGASGSISPTHAIVVDTTAPTVTGVASSTANGTYGVGGAVTITVSFSEAVTVTGTPTLALNSGGSASYSAGSGTSTLTFGYTAAAGHNTTDLDYSATSSLAGTIRDAAGNNATLTLAAPGTAGWLGATKAIVIDTAGPTVTNVTSSTANGTYGLSAGIAIQVSFSEAVTVTGTPTLALNTGATASYTSGSGTATLTFGYTVGAAQNTSDLDYSATSSLSGTIRDAVLNNATLTLPAVGGAGSLGFNKNLAIDTTGPVVVGVTSPNTDAAYTSGASLSIQVGFSEAVTVTGTPTLALNTGATASYTSGSGTATLTFTYGVLAGQNTADLDYVATTSLAGTITDGPGNAANRTLAAPGTSGSLGFAKAIVIDTVAPSVTNVTSSTADGAYRAGASISIQVSFSEAVAVTGTPTLALNTGATVNYASGSGTSTLTFGYTVGAGQNIGDLNYVATNSLTGTIRDAATNLASVTLPATTAAGSLGVNKNIVIDTIAPTVVNVTSPNPDNTYRSGSLTVTVQLSEAVTVQGSPLLLLNTTDQAVYTSGSGTNVLSFTYTLVNGHNTGDLDEMSSTALTLNGGKILDVASNAAVLTVPSPQAAGSLGFNKRIVIDTGPVVIDVTSFTNDGTYGAGTSVGVRIQFNENVSYTGLPYMTLDSGGVAIASDSSGPYIYMNYNVLAGHASLDLDYLNTASLVANGTIRDSSGTDASLTLPTPDGPGSLGFNKNIQIVNGMTRFTAGTVEWPDDACRDAAPFGLCTNITQSGGNLWSTQTCLNHGYTKGAWTGVHYGFCSGPESMYCTSDTCAAVAYERACQSSDQTTLEFTCWAGVHAVWDKGWATGGINFSNGDRTISQGSSGTTNVRASVGRSSGKYYWEIKAEAGNSSVNGGGLGIVGSDWPNTASSVGDDASSFGFGYGPLNQLWHVKWNQLSTSTSGPNGGTAVNAGNVYMFALDLDNKRLFVGMNGGWFLEGDPVSGIRPAASSWAGSVVYPAVSFTGGSSNAFTANFGNADFAYPVPFGYKAGWF